MSVHVLWMSEANRQELLLSLYHEGSGDQIQVMRFGSSKYLYQLSHLCCWPFVLLLRQCLIQPRLTSNYYRVEDNLELLILVPSPPKCWDYKHVPSHCVFMGF